MSLRFLQHKWNRKPAQAGDIEPTHAKQGDLVNPADLVYDEHPGERIPFLITERKPILSIQDRFSTDDFHWKAP